MVMLVLFVTYDYGETGGQGRFSQGLVRALKRSGSEVDVISPESLNRTSAQALTRWPGHPGFSLAAALELRSVVDSDGFDLLHVNGGPGGVFLPLPQRLPVVYTAHHTYAQQARLVGGQGWKRTLGFAEKLSYRNSCAIAADTPSTADSLLREYGIPAKLITIIPCGIDFEAFHPSQEPKASQTCLFVGRLDARKGFFHLIRAWTRVVRRHPEARLLVVGDGPERPGVERHLTEAGISASVSFLGRVDSEELVRLYGQAQCVVVPSVFEGFGLAALEALACGTRVVARNVEGLRDVITDRDLGTLVPPDDIEAFAEAIIDEFDHGSAIDPSTRARLMDKYDWAVVEREYRHLYADALR